MRTKMIPFKTKTQERTFHHQGQTWIYEGGKHWLVPETITMPQAIEGTARHTVKRYYGQWARQVRRRSKFPGCKHPKTPVWYYVDDPLGRMISVNEG